MMTTLLSILKTNDVFKNTIVFRCDTPNMLFFVDLFPKNNLIFQ